MMRCKTAPIVRPWNCGCPFSVLAGIRLERFHVMGNDYDRVFVSKIQG